MKFTLTLLLALVFPWFLQAQYCTPESDCTFGDNLSYFSINGFVNESTCELSGYSDFTNLSSPILLSPGLSCNATFTTNFYLQSISLWIDTDNSNSFESTELLVSDLASGYSTVSTEILIPADLAFGTYRLRVQTLYNGSSAEDACMVLGYGETEDYTVVVGEAPNCFFSGDFVYESITSETVSVNWQTTEDVVIDAEIGLSGFVPTGVPTSGYDNVGTQITFSDLSGGTAYQIYLRNDCESDNLNTSFWSGPHSFTTLCTAESAPYEVDFSGPIGSDLSACWRGRQSPELTGNIFTTEVQKWDIGVAPDIVGSDFWALRYGFGSGAGLYDWAIMPLVDLSGGSGYQLSFNLSTTGNDNETYFPLVGNDEMRIIISGDYGQNWTELDVFLAGDGGETQLYSYDISAFAEQEVLIAFAGTAITNSRIIFIQNLEVIDAAGCGGNIVASTSEITTETANLAWTYDGNATLFDIEFGPIGFTPTGQPTTGYDDVMQGTTLTGLSTGGSYDVYIRADCNGDNMTGLSAWSLKYTFTAGCDVELPYFQDFSSFVPGCWEEATGGGALFGPNDYESNTFFATQESSPFGAGAFGLNLNKYLSEWLISPEFDLTDAVGAQLDFDLAHTAFNSSNQGEFNSNDDFYLVAAVDGWFEVTVLQSWEVGDIISNAGQHFSYDISQFVGDDVMFAFFYRGSQSSSGPLNSGTLFGDNFAVEVNFPSVNIVSTMTSDISCAGENDGAISLIIEGGTPPLSFIWSNGANEQNLTDLPAGSYTCTITDAIQNELISSEITVSEPAAINVDANVSPISVTGANDGAIDITTTGGVAPYSFVWSTGVPIEDLSNLPFGEYCVTVTDDNDCVAEFCYAVDLFSDLSNINYLESYEVFPNPVSDNLQVELKLRDKKEFQLHVTDIFGRKLLPVQRFNVEQEVINISTENFPTGVFYIQILFSEDQKSIVRSVIK